MIRMILEYGFMQRAILAALLACITCGIIGVIAVEKRLVLLSGGIAHTAYGGVGLGYFLGIEPMIGAFAAAILTAVGIGRLSKKDGHTDMMIGLFWSLGMAIGILFIMLTPGYPPDLTSVLFGGILSVTRFDLWLSGVITITVLWVIAAYFQHWKAYLFDERFARTLGIRTDLMRSVLMSLIAMAVVSLIRVAGIVLVLALFSAPPAMAAQLFSTLTKRMVASILIGFAFCFCGLWISYALEVPSGATIVVLAASGYFCTIAIKAVVMKRLGRNYM